VVVLAYASGLSAEDSQFLTAAQYGHSPKTKEMKKRKNASVGIAIGDVYFLRFFLVFFFGISFCLRSSLRSSSGDSLLTQVFCVN